LSAVCLINPVRSEKSSRLAIIQKAPGFVLVNQAGKNVSQDDIRGKVSLVSFIFTTCNGACPATTHRLQLIQTALKDRGLLKNGSIQLISIKLDPDRDAPDALRDYMKLYDAEPNSWTFLSGLPDDVKKVNSAWGMWTKPAANNQLDHPSRVFLVDKKGQIR